MLQDWGYGTIIGPAVEPVVAQLEAEGRVPAAAICDFNLADGETGIDAARVLFQFYGSALPVVIVTGTSGRAARRLAEPYHIPVLSKPVDPDVLQSYLPTP